MAKASVALIKVEKEALPAGGGAGLSFMHQAVDYMGELVFKWLRV